jgi:hypothetical protein
MTFGSEPAPLFNELIGMTLGTFAHKVAHQRLDWTAHP